MVCRTLLVILGVLACVGARPARAGAADLLSFPSTALAVPGGSEECGYPADDTRLERVQTGVPLLFRATVLSDEATARLHATRKRAIDRERADLVPCRLTDTYLRGLLAKLVSGSQLEAFAESFPEIALIAQCRPGTALPGARAAPGHVLIVPRSLVVLASSEDAIAAVLAHELAHFTLRHTERLIEASEGHAYVALDAREMRSEHEREADITGLRIMVNAGYDPWAAVDHLGSVEAIAEGLLAARPSCDDCRHDEPGSSPRIARLRAQIRACRYPVPRARTSVPAAVRDEVIPGVN
jgi:predicted Zn-dependent protease